MGADVATSLPLTPTTYLWIFGDSLIGRRPAPGAWRVKGGVHAFPRQTLGNPPSPPSLPPSLPSRE
jgi:hypothetical protein